MTVPCIHRSIAYGASLELTLSTSNSHKSSSATSAVHTWYHNRLSSVPVPCTPDATLTYFQYQCRAHLVPPYGRGIGYGAPWNRLGYNCSASWYWGPGSECYYGMRDVSCPALTSKLLLLSRKSDLVLGQRHRMQLGHAACGTDTLYADTRIGGLGHDIASPASAVGCVTCHGRY
eukprot:2271869-Rhodomonas_salina.2